MYLVWAVALLRRRSEGRRAVAVISYFGVVWYLITDIPLLIAGPEARHLYLPAVGPCIATAFLAMPTCFLLQKNAGYVRLLGAALLISLFGCQLRKENNQFVELGETSARGTTQMAAIMTTIPKQTLVIIQFPDSVFLPFALQRPFTSTDLYSQARSLVSPMALPAPKWWGRPNRYSRQNLQAPRCAQGNQSPRMGKAESVVAVTKRLAPKFSSSLRHRIVGRSSGLSKFRLGPRG